MGLIGFLPTKAEGAIGGVDYTPEERKKIAAAYCLSQEGTDIRSRDYICPSCKVRNIELLPDAGPSSTTGKTLGTPPALSFGYRKDQNDSTPQNISAASTFV